ncbi:MAG: hypothetical protein KatS3mg121_1466 [Gammaproteobacteria bacterium]|nr:MAG: hypothetical protein KatS3mg121_1466 [Gammaproteobacteria bacterium]
MLTQVSSLPVHPSGPLDTAALGERAPRRGAPAADASTAGPREVAPAVDAASLQRVAEALDRFMVSRQRSVQFRLDETSGRTVITVVNTQTDEVVRQIPPEQLLKLAGMIEKMLLEGGGATPAGALLEAQG